MFRSFARPGCYAGAILAALFALPAAAQKEIKIGVLYDLTGPFAGGGSEAAYLGNKIAIDMINEKGGVEGYQIEALYADAQSKPEVAINEAVRLIEQEKVDMLLGFYSSAQCVPAAPASSSSRSSCGSPPASPRPSSRTGISSTSSARSRAAASSA